MRSEIAVLLTGFAFLFGFLAGEAFPQHHYAAIVTQGGHALVLVDTATGKVCSPTRNAIDKSDTAAYIDSLTSDPSTPDSVKQGKDLLKRSNDLDATLGPACPQ
jgi:hypothetical protein